VIYYGGHAARNTEDVPDWVTDCGFMLHGANESVEGYGGSSCVACVPHVDPSSLFAQVLELSNDILFILDCHLDTVVFTRWAQHHIRIQATFNHAERPRNAQAMCLQQVTSRFEHHPDRSCDNEQCRRTVAVRPLELLQPYATQALADILCRLHKNISQDA